MKTVLLLLSIHGFGMGNNGTYTTALRDTPIVKCKGESDDSRFGYACGIVGTPPKMRQNLEYLLKEKNYAIITCWLRESLSREVRAYGLEGIYRAALAGYQLTKEDIVVMDSLIKDPKSIQGCSGCMGYNWTYAEIVSPKEMKRIQNPRFLANERRREKNYQKWYFRTYSW